MIVPLDFQNILLIITALVNALLLFVVYFKASRRGRLNELYSINILAILAWVLAMIGYRSAPESTAFVWTLVLYLAPTFIASTFLYFTLVFPPERRQRNLRLKKYAVILGNLAIVAALFTPGFILEDVTVREGAENSIMFGSGYALYALYILSFFSGGFLILLRNYLSSSGVARMQVLYVGIGYSSAAFLAFITNLILPWFGIFTLNWLGQVFTFAMVGFATYAIFRHHLFNVRVIATEVFIFVLWVFLLVQALLARTFADAVIGIILLASTVVLGILLIRSVLKEIESRERIEKLADKLAEANKHLKELDKRKSEFISLASHQLRTPLTAIKGYSSMILEGSFGKFPQKMKQPLERIFKSSDRLVKVIEDYLTISRIEQDRIEYDFRDADLVDIVRTVAEEARPDAEEKGLALEDFVEKKGMHTVAADREKLVQVLGNVVDNAIKYTNEGTITITLSKIPEEQMFRVAIADTGIGMTKKSQEKLFQKFTRGKGGTETDSSGSGLGLYIAKRIVEAHGGTIRAESEGKGEGSTFTIELPMRE